MTEAHDIAMCSQALDRLADHGCGTALVFARTETDGPL